MAVESSMLVDEASRSPTLPVRPGIQAPSFSTSTLRPPSTVSETRKIVPTSVRYTPDGRRLTRSEYTLGRPASGPGARRTAPPAGDNPGRLAVPTRSQGGTARLVRDVDAVRQAALGGLRRREHDVREPVRVHLRVDEVQ